MIKLTYCIMRKQGMDADEFRRTWLEDHAPLVKRYADAINAVRYVQSHTVHDQANAGFKAWRGLSDPYDGVTEIWWNSMDEFEAANKTDAGAAAGIALAKDEQRFIDFERSSLFLTQEHEIF